MRTLLLILLLAFVTSIEASCLSAGAELNIRSDYPLNIRFDSIVAPGESVNTSRGTVVFTNETEENLEFYRVSGSVHSGYFLDGVIVGPENCVVLDHFELESE